MDASDQIRKGVESGRERATWREPGHNQRDRIAEERQGRDRRAPAGAYGIDAVKEVHDTSIDPEMVDQKKT